MPCGLLGGAERDSAAWVDGRVGLDAWIGHHDIAMNWPEMAFHTAARLAEVIFLGPLTSEIQAWIESSALTARLRAGNFFAGGFQRLSGWSDA
jgi:hypothetical protein